MRKKTYLVLRASYITNDDTRRTENFGETGIEVGDIEELRKNLKNNNDCSRVLLVYSEKS